jgi:phage baseplate assembly protein W
MASGLTPKLPLIRGDVNDFELITSYLDLVKQNFKNVMLTNPGERVMDVNFGAGLNRFLFGQDSFSMYSRVAGKIKEQASKYLPYINIEDISFETSENNSDLQDNFLKVQIVYNIVPLETLDSVELTLPTD